MGFWKTIRDILLWLLAMASIIILGPVCLVLGTSLGDKVKDYIQRRMVAEKKIRQQMAEDAAVEKEEES